MTEHTDLGQELATRLLESLNPDLFYSRRGGNPDEGGRLRFGLTGALDEITARYAEHSSDPDGLAVAQLRIAQAFIQERNPGYHAPFITEAIRNFEQGRGDSMAQRHQLRLAKESERLAAPYLLDRLKKHYKDSVIFRLEEKKPALFLPANWSCNIFEDTLAYIDFWRNEEQTKSTDDEIVGIFSLDLDSNNAATRADCLENFEYDKEITEPWLEISKAVALMQFTNSMNRQEQRRAEHLSNIYSVRQGALEQDPFMEYAIRLQIKIIPELGRQLDEEFFWLSSQANAFIKHEDCETVPHMWKRHVLDMPSLRPQ